MSSIASIGSAPSRQATAEEKRDINSLAYAMPAGTEVKLYADGSTSCVLDGRIIAPENIKMYTDALTILNDIIWPATFECLPRNPRPAENKSFLVMASEYVTDVIWSAIREVTPWNAFDEPPATPEDAAGAESGRSALDEGLHLSKSYREIFAEAGIEEPSGMTAARQWFKDVDRFKSKHQSKISAWTDEFEARAKSTSSRPAI